MVGSNQPPDQPARLSAEEIRAFQEGQVPAAKAERMLGGRAPAEPPKPVRAKSAGADAEPQSPLAISAEELAALAAGDRPPALAKRLGEGSA